MQPKYQRASIKIALVLLNPQYIRSWIESGLIDDLIKDKKINVTVFAPQHVLERIHDYNNVEKVLIESIEPSRAATHLVAMNWIEKRKRSTTFQFALKRTFCTDYNPSGGVNSCPSFSPGYQQNCSIRSRRFCCIEYFSI